MLPDTPLVHAVIGMQDARVQLEKAVRLLAELAALDEGNAHGIGDVHARAARTLASWNKQYKAMEDIWHKERFPNSPTSRKARTNRRRPAKVPAVEIAAVH